MGSLKLLVKPTYKCNLNCEYCYSKKFIRSKDMNVETIKKICKNTKNCNDVLWIWHGGEPLMMPKEFYKEAQLILNKYGINRVSMQSNGTLIDDDWIDMFKKFDWSISLSFDGLKNDEKRSGSDKILENIQKLKDNGLTVSIIKVLGENDINTMCSDYEYYKKIGINSFQINRVFKSPGLSVSTLDKKVSKYIEKYKELLELWINDSSPIHIRHFAEFIQFMLGSSDYICTHRGKCIHEWFSVDPEGVIYPCDRWYPNEFILGNIHDFDDFNEVKLTDTYKRNLQLMESRKSFCKDIECLIYPFCNGGCNINAILHNGGSKVDEGECMIRKGEVTTIFNAIKNLDPYTVKNPILQNILIESGFRNINFIKKLMEGRYNDEKYNINN